MTDYPIGTILPTKGGWAAEKKANADEDGDTTWLHYYPNGYKVNWYHKSDLRFAWGECRAERIHGPYTVEQHDLIAPEPVTT